MQDIGAVFYILRKFLPHRHEVKSLHCRHQIYWTQGQPQSGELHQQTEWQRWSTMTFLCRQSRSDVGMQPSFLFLSSFPFKISTFRHSEEFNTLNCLISLTVQPIFVLPKTSRGNSSFETTGGVGGGRYSLRRD